MSAVADDTRIGERLKAWDLDYRDGWQLITESQDLAPVVDSFRGSIIEELGCDPSDVTGAIVRTEEGDYQSVWFTAWSRPWAEDAVYTKVR